MRLLLWGSKTNFVELKVDKQKNLGYHNLFPNQRKQLEKLMKQIFFRIQDILFLIHGIQNAFLLLM